MAIVAAMDSQTDQKAQALQKHKKSEHMVFAWLIKPNQSLPA